MKLTIFYLSLLFSFGYQQTIPDQINGYIEQLREAIPEVIEVSELNVQLPDNQYLTGDLNITSLTLEGLKAFNMSVNYVLNLIPTDFVLTVDSMDLELNYLADLALLNSSLIHIFGNGPASVVLTNFTVIGNIALTLVPLNLSLNGIEMHLDDGKFTFEGVLNDDTFSKELSDLISSSAADIFNENQAALSTVIEDALNTAIADILSKNSTVSSSLDEINNEMYLSEVYKSFDPLKMIQDASETLFKIFTSLLQN